MSTAPIRNQAVLAGPPGITPGWLIAFPAGRAVTDDVRVARLLITRGLPASGKTTFSRGLQPLVARVNRDDLRRMLHGRPMYTPRAERQVTLVQTAAVEGLLRAGADVVVDDTNLRSRTVRGWATLAARCGASFEVYDFTDVPVDECVRRDAARDESVRVGEAAIRWMYDRYLKGRTLPLPIPEPDGG